MAKTVFILSTFFFLFSTAPEICQFLAGPEEAQAAAPVNSWWNLNHGARKKITVMAGSANVPNAYTVSITIDHASLVTAKQSLSSGDDVRVAYYSGSTWTELDRSLDESSSWNNASTKIWFKTQAAINASAYDDNYYLYYSYPSASSPSASKANVFDMWDDFNNIDNWTTFSDGGSQMVSATASGGTVTIDAGGANLGGLKHNTYSPGNTYGFVARSRARSLSVVTDDLAPVAWFINDPSTGMYAYFTRDNRNLYVETVANNKIHEDATTGPFPVADTWYIYELYRKTGGTIKVLRDGSQQFPPGSGWSNGDTAFTSGPLGIGGESNGGQDYEFDWIWARKFVDPEPITVVGTQVTKTWGENSACHYTSVTEDSYLDQGQPNYNMGAETLLRVGDESGTRADRTIMKFNFSNINITDSSQIISASLKVRTHSNPVSGNVIVDAFRVKKNWNEGNKSYAQADANEVTWTYEYYNTTGWTGAGCDDTSDRSTTSDGTQTFSAVDTWYTWDVTGSAKYMYANNQYYGWILKAQSEGTAKYWRVQSSENPTAGNRPYLEITYIDKTLAEARYEYRKKLTIQSSQVGASCSSNLSDFPVLVSLSGNWLKTKANDPTNGHIYNSNGYDIAFRGENDETVLNYEIEKYDPVNGTLIAWVKIPTLYYNKNTEVYIYYGNAGITSAPAATVAQGVWDSNFKAIYHLKETSGDQDDSTSNGIHLINLSLSEQGTEVGIANGADRFNAATNRYADTNYAGTSAFDVASGDSMTVEGWIKTSESGAYQFVVNRKDTDGDPTWQLLVDDGNKANFRFSDGAGHSPNISSSMTVNSGTYRYLVGRWDGSTKTAEIFVDGSSAGSTQNSSVGANAVTRFLRIGQEGDDNGGYGFTGYIDEVRFSSTFRSNCWIQTSYSSMNTPSSFISEGTETRPAPTVVTLRSFGGFQYGDGVLLKWKTSHEVNNLGFNVYRETNGELLRLTPELIAGSALLAGSGTPLTAGHHYVWWDTIALSDQPSAVNGQRSALRYWLEDVDLTGKRTFHGPVEVQLSASSFELSAPDLRRAELLSEFGMRLQEKYADFWKVQDLREKLKATHDRGASRLRRDSRTGLSGLKDRPSALRQKNFGLLTSSEALLKRSAPSGNSVPDPQANAVQRSLAGRPAMKLLVREEGWYRVSQPELAAAGMNTNFNPKHLHLYADGNELPIRVIAEKDNQFGPRDAIEFYGIGLDTPSTDARVYWLVVGSRPGKRMPVSRAQGGQASLTAFPYTAESKERSFYFPALLNGEDPNFFGPIIYTYRVDQLLYVWDADPTSLEDALLEVALQGATSGPHRVKVFFNDAEVGEVSFSGQSQARFQAEIPVSVLHSGENLVSFIAHGGEMDISLLDSIHLTYWRAYRAHENGLKLTAQGGRQVSVGGFSHARIRVVDITDPQSVMEVEGKVKAQSSGHEVSFRVPGSGPRTLLALGVEKVKSPAQLVFNQPSNWNQRGNGYDLVIISHKDFLESLKPLKNLRETQGLSVALVDVEDVYDEFSFGAKTPQAIKDFLQRATSSWQKPPRFVLLVGDASYDPRNFLGYGDLDFVPTQLVDTAYLETASDDWFVDFDGDGLPDMAIGRLPVQTPAEASAMVAKIIAYEKSSGVNEALLVADKTEKTDDFDFVEAAQKVGALFPSTVGVRKVFRGEFDSDAQAKEALLNHLGQGPLLVNYLGHGGMMEWRGHVLTTDDAEGLLSGQRLPFFINMTCLNGFFQAPYGDTLAESLLKAENGGAVAVWTSSGMTEPGGQLLMNQELVRLLFSPEGMTIGEAAMKAKASVSDMDIRRTWILFGDPTTRLK